MKITIPDGPTFELHRSTVLLIIAGIVALAAILTSFYTVAPQEEGVVLRFGRRVAANPPGLHFKLPFLIDRVLKVPVATVDVEEFGYRSRRGQDTTGEKAVRRGYEEESTMLTGDLNIVQVGWDVQFRRADPENFLFEVHEPINTLRDISQSVMRQVVGDRASIQVLTTERAEIQEETKQLIDVSAKRMQLGMQIVEVNLLFVEPPVEVIDAFHDLNKAEQDAQRFFEEASREYEERVNLSRGTASRRVEEAQGYRERRVNVANGESDRFRNILQEYSKAPEVTRRRLYLETLEEYLPRVSEVVVISEGQTTSPVPLFDLRRGTRPAPAAPATEGGAP